MKKYLFILLCLGSASLTYAQSELDLTGVDEVIISANFSALLIQASNSAEASVRQVMKINDRDQPQLRKLAVNRRGSTLVIDEVQPTISDLKNQFSEGFYHLTDGDTSSHYFGSYQDYRERPDLPVIESQITIFLPPNIALKVTNEYGSIRVEGMTGLQSARTKYGAVEVIMDKPHQSAMKVSSEYGAVDVTLSSAADAQLQLKTAYGELFTDFNIIVDTDASERGDYRETVVGKIGAGGPEIACNAPYGNVYLRRMK